MTETIITLTIGGLWAILLVIGVCVQRRRDRRQGEQWDRDQAERAKRIERARAAR